MNYNDFNLTNQKYLIRNNPKNLIIYQNSHWDENFEFGDVFLPNSTIFEGRNKMYINCLGLLKRINLKLPYSSKLNDIEIYNNLFQFLLKYSRIDKFENLIKSYIIIFLIIIKILLKKNFFY